MSVKRKCRSCILAKKYSTELPKHFLMQTNFVCLLCNKVTKWYSHPSDELSGDALECKSCHNYIIYVLPNFPDINKWKDEIYIPSSAGDILVMRDYEYNITYISINDKKVTTLQHILEFKSLDDLVNKVKTITVFS